MCSKKEKKTKANNYKYFREIEHETEIFSKIILNVQRFQEKLTGKTDKKNQFL